MALNIKKDFGTTRNRPDVTSLIYGKVPPQAPELEEAVLGALMLERDRLEEVFGIITSEECFYVDANQKIFCAIKKIYQLGLPVDLLTVTEYLRKSNELELIGGAHYLTNLTMAVISSAHVQTHAMMIMEKFFARELIRVGGTIVNDAYEDSHDVFELLELAERSISAITSENISSEAKSLKSLIPSLLQEKEEQHNSKTDCSGVTTGYELLDNITTGWKKSHLNIIAARPAIGKTAFALNLIRNAARSNTPAAIFSLEMSKDEIIDRLCAMDLNMNHQLIKHPNNMNNYDYQRYVEGSLEIAKLPIYIDDSANISSLQLRSKALKLKKLHNIGLIVIDYLQLMKGNTQRNGSREQEISQISRELKTMAKDLQVPVIALSQLNRAVESRGDNIPRLADLRESGAIEQDADMVCFLYGAPEKPQDGFDNTNEKEVMFLISKNRHGNTGDILFRLKKNFQRFEEAESAGKFQKSYTNNNNYNNYTESEDIF